MNFTYKNRIRHAPYRVIRTHWRDSATFIRLGKRGDYWPDDHGKRERVYVRYARWVE